MLGRSAGGSWRAGSLVYVGSRNQLLLHKGEFGDGGQGARRVRLCEMICTVKYLKSKSLGRRSQLNSLNRGGLAADAIEQRQDWGEV